MNMGRTSSSPSARLCRTPTLSVIRLPPLILPASGRQRVKPGLPQPVVHVLAADPLWDEPQRVPHGERDVGNQRELVGDLGGRIARADDDHPHPGIRHRVAVLGHVQQRAAEAVLAREDGPVGVRERAARGDDPRRWELPSIGRS